MEQLEKIQITVQTTINARVEKVWKLWTSPEHITKWNNASEDWHTPYAENDLQAGGKFLSRMEAKDGSMGFDLIGTYDFITTNESMEYTLGDDRKVSINFTSAGAQTSIIETFEAETTHPIEFQKGGWQSILDNFKKHVESSD
ncbi:MAG: SRPBCC family protein [Mariniphaga sp.]